MGTEVAVGKGVKEGCAHISEVAVIGSTTSAGVKGEDEMCIGEATA